MRRRAGGPSCTCTCTCVGACTCVRAGWGAGRHPLYPHSLRPRPRGGVTVQVGAFATPDQATVGLNRAMGLASGRAAGRSTEIAAATVNGAQMYRALIHGFATRTEAQAFCARLQAQGQPCLVRP